MFKIRENLLQDAVIRCKYRWWVENDKTKNKLKEGAAIYYWNVFDKGSFLVGHVQVLPFSQWNISNYVTHLGLF